MAAPTYATRWALRLCEENDLVQMEPGVSLDVPQSKQWMLTQAIDLAMDEIERSMRARKGTAEPIEIGRLGIRTKTRLRPIVAATALHYLYEQLNSYGDGSDGKFAHKASLHARRADTWLDEELELVDYDIDNSGNIDDIEKNQPMPSRFIRG